MSMQLIQLTALAIAAFMQADVSPQQDRPALAVPPARQANHVAIIEVHGPIDAMTRESVKRRAEDAVRDGVDLIVLELDTPGGDLEATLDICNFIKQEVPVRTVRPPHASQSHTHRKFLSHGHERGFRKRFGTQGAIRIFGGTARIAPRGQI